MKSLVISLLIIICIGVISGIYGCTEADMASRNLSTSAEQFEVARRIVFVNSITDKYLLSIEGLCSTELRHENKQLEVTCKDGPNSYKKHFLGLSDNVTYFVEQVSNTGVNTAHYRVIFRPSVIVPNVDVK